MRHTYLPLPHGQQTIRVSPRRFADTYGRSGRIRPNASALGAFQAETAGSRHATSPPDRLVQHRRLARWTRLAAVLVLPAVWLALPLSAHAAQFCVSTSQALNTALDLAEANGQDNEIRLVRGTIAPAAPDPDYYLYSYGSSHDRQLEISGGWSPDCSTQDRNPDSTVVAANDSLGVFRVLVGSAAGNARFKMHNLTISGSSNSSQHGRGTGLTVYGYQYAHGQVEIDRVIFSDHHCTGTASSGCALYVGFGIKQAMVRNSLFHNNRAATAAAMRIVVTEDIQPLIRLHNNTVVDNYVDTNSAQAASAVEISGADNTVLMYNNILFNNHSLNTPAPLPDLVRSAPGAILGKHNSIAASAVTWTPDTSGNRSVAPVFAGRASDYRLRGNSPLRDVGFNAGWPTLGLLELGGGSRVLGPTIDLGAYESDILFNSGFGD